MRSDKTEITQINYKKDGSKEKYIRMEKREIIKRIKHHKSDIKYGKGTIALVKLNNFKNLKINFNNEKNCEL